MSAEEPGHGTAKRYNHGTRTTPPCRCLPCREAKQKVNRDRHRRRAYGLPSPMIDAGPVRVHVEGLLAAGMSAQQVSRMSGVAAGQLRRLLGRDPTRPASRTIRRENAAKLFAVTAGMYGDDDVAGARVPAVGTARRLQALVASGRRLSEVQRELGISYSTLNDIAHGYTVRVHVRVARQVRDFTSQTWHVPPPQRTPDERARVSSARYVAQRNGWLPFAVWDDVDDPDERPKGAVKTAHAA